MRAQNQTFQFGLLRCFLISALAVSGVTLLAGIVPAVFTSRVVLAETGNDAERAAPDFSGSTSTYHWNLNEADLPLIDLPEHISGGLDLSLTYSMDQFEFPLFQSLYYNQRAGKYILMLIGKAEPSPQPGSMVRHAEFIDLVSVGGDGNFAASGKLNLRLQDRGGVKVLSVAEETVYTFAALADGELHCSQINDHHGVVINLKYTSDASLQTINDNSGRTINFTYANQSVSSITQTWKKDSKRVSQTWAIAGEVRFAHAPGSTATTSALGATAKHVPSNAIKATYTRAMAASDLQLAGIFGGPSAIAAANGFEPAGLGHQYPLYRGDLIGDDGRILRGHLSFAMHLYGSVDGTGDTEIYVPPGFTTHTDKPTPTDAVVTFYYPRLGNLTDVTLAVFHVKNFRLTDEGGRVHIGSIGGPGGSISSYRHSHLEFYRGNTGLPPLAARVQLRIDPALVFGNAE